MSSDDTEKGERACGSETDPLLGKRKPGVLLQIWPWLNNLNIEFGSELLSLLFVTEHLNKGFAYTMQGNAEPYLYKIFNVPAPQVQIFESLTSLPWAAKPMIGLVSDMFPLGGFNKSPYLLIYSVLGVVGFVALGVLPYRAFPIIFFVLLLVCVNLQESAGDTLSEAKYAAEIMKKPLHGPDMLTYVWFGLTFAGLVATVVSGCMLKYWGPRSVFLVCIPFAAAAFWPALMGYFGERQRTEEETKEVRRKIGNQWEACFLSVVVFSCSLLLMIVGCITQSPVINSAVSLFVSVIMLLSFSVLLSPVIARLNAFIFLDMALSFDISGATFYFYTDSPAEYPDGPHFSPFFYTTVLGVVGSVFSLVGIYCYNRFTSDLTYRNLMITVNCVGSAFNVLDVIMFARLNLKWGIPDDYMVLGASISGDIFYYWSWMPLVVVLSHLCPPDMEATTYALLAGSANLGETVADNFGSLLLQVLQCEPSGSLGESAQFKNLWLAAVITTILPLVEIIGLIWLVPNARQNEKIPMDSDRDITSGSLWKRLTK